MSEHLTSALGVTSTHSVPGVTERPVLVETTGGVFGATVTVPDGPSRAALAILVGLSEDRSGANGLWRVLAQTLGGLGVTVLRCDTPGVCDSHLVVEGYEGERATLEVVRWFTERTDGLPLAVLGYCNGATAAIRLAMEAPVPVAVGLVTPPRKLFAPQAPQARQGAQRIKGALSSLRNRSVSNGPRTDTRAEVRTEVRADVQGEDDDITGILERMPSHVPTWILSGTDDRGIDVARNLVNRRGNDDQLCLEVIEGVEVHWFSTPDIQREVVQRTVRWCERVLEALPKGAP